MSVFDFQNYREFILANLGSMPRGSKSSLAKSIGIHSTTLSQILKGDKSMTLEHAALACDFFALNESQAEYFVLLVQIDRAGNESLRKLLKSQARRMQGEGKDLKKILPKGKKITPAQQTVFYSHWVYSAIRVLCSIEGFQTPEALAERLRLPKKDLLKLVESLLDMDLCRKEGPLIKPGSRFTHLESQSPLIPRHHSNWRLKAMERHPFLEDSELAYSAAMSLSHEDALRIRKLLQETIATVQAIREPSPCEAAWVLGVDWTKF